MTIFNQLSYMVELGTGIGATIHDYGCAETSIASLLVNCFGKQTDPLQLNQALISINGYAFNGENAYDLIKWEAITGIYPDVTLAFNNSYTKSPADMNLIDGQLSKGCSVVVGVDPSNNPASEIVGHYVEVYKKNSDGTYQCRDPLGGLDIVFNSKYAVNGMSVAQCILQAISYNGTVASVGVNLPSATFRKLVNNSNVADTTCDLLKLPRNTDDATPTGPQNIVDAIGKLQTDLTNSNNSNQQKDNQNKLLNDQILALKLQIEQLKAQIAELTTIPPVVTTPTPEPTTNPIPQPTPEPVQPPTTVPVTKSWISVLIAWLKHFEPTK
jgi:hypothetical protein